MESRVLACELLSGFDNDGNFQLIQLLIWMDYCVHDEKFKQKLRRQINVLLISFLSNNNEHRFVKSCLIIIAFLLVVSV